VKPVVVADASPIIYLNLISEIDILVTLFGETHIPAEVFEELSHPAAPLCVRDWALAAPEWLRVERISIREDPTTLSLDSGERAAIALAEQMKADLVLMDERKGTRVCLRKGFLVAGTLGILDRAARRGLVDLEDSFSKLKATNFRYRPEMMASILSQFPKSK
jgi:predicted nucleic acid-binding protein